MPDGLSPLRSRLVLQGCRRPHSLPLDFWRTSRISFASAIACVGSGQASAARSVGREAPARRRNREALRRQPVTPPRAVPRERAQRRPPRDEPQPEQPQHDSTYTGTRRWPIGGKLPRHLGPRQLGLEPCQLDHALTHLPCRGNDPSIRPGLRTHFRMTLRRWGGMGACDARTQGVQISADIWATEDAAACVPSTFQRHKASF